jgi:hypothetical protein
MFITYNFFVSKAADPWVVVDGLLSRGEPQLEVKATPGQKTVHYYQRASILRNTINVSDKHFGTPKSTLD